MKRTREIGECRVLSESVYGKPMYGFLQAYENGENFFLSEDAFLHHPEWPCYAPDQEEICAPFDQEFFTGNDLLFLCGNDRILAHELVREHLNGLHPESVIDDLVASGEWHRCSNCGKLFANRMEQKPCPQCGELSPDNYSACYCI